MWEGDDTAVEIEPLEGRETAQRGQVELPARAEGKLSERADGVGLPCRLLLPES
jgi:hypothetical protein